MPHHEMRQIVHRCANTSKRADIRAPWHGSSSRLQKMKSSVISRLPQTWAPRRVEEYATKVEALITAAWKIFGQVSAEPFTTFSSSFHHLSCHKERQNVREGPLITATFQSDKLYSFESTPFLERCSIFHNAYLSS